MNFRGPKPLFLRYMHSDQLLEYFFVSAISSILLIRTFLYFTGYPQLGGGGFHIAHLLWGGIFMLGALVISLASIGYRSMRLVAVIGGVGFGAFIDEIGKFVTSDNNYFFQPSIVLLYLIFLGLYFLFRAIGRARGMTDQEYAVNALMMGGEVVQNDLDAAEKQHLEAMIAHLDPNSPVARALAELLRQIELADTPPPGLLTRLKQSVRQSYGSLSQQSWFPRLIAAIMIMQAIVGMTATGIAWGQQLGAGSLSPSRTLEGVCVVVSSGLIVSGLWWLRKSKVRAYDRFRMALIFDIFLTQFFVFYREQFSAVLGLAFKLLLLVAIEYVLSQERKRDQQAYARA